MKNEKSEWETIFNGKNLDGWTVKIKGYPSGDNFGNTFKVVDEVIQVHMKIIKILILNLVIFTIPIRNIKITT